MQKLLQIFFNQKTGYVIERVDKYLLPELFARPRPLKASLRQKCEASELHAK